MTKIKEIPPLKLPTDKSKITVKFLVNNEYILIKRTFPKPPTHHTIEPVQERELSNSYTDSDFITSSNPLDLILIRDALDKRPLYDNAIAIKPTYYILKTTTFNTIKTKPINQQIIMLADCNITKENCPTTTNN